MMRKYAKLLLDQLYSQGITNEKVLEAIFKTPREKFVNKKFKYSAWKNIALPIGYRQTISQPYIVARMTELLELSPKHRVLEIGTGSGYQTAILSHLVHHVFSVERIKDLKKQAQYRFEKLNLHNISVIHGDGWEGWKKYSPFDAIIVTAAVSKVPKALLLQLNTKGVLVLPVGNNQQLLKRIRRCGIKFIVDTIASVRFVPLIKGELS